MARKRFPSQHPSLFPPEPDEPPAPPADDPSQPEGGPRALHDDRPRTPPAAPGTPRPAPRPAAAAGGGRSLFDGIESPPRSLEGAAGPGQAGERPGADRERG